MRNSDDLFLNGIKIANLISAVVVVWLLLKAGKMLISDGYAGLFAVIVLCTLAGASFALRLAKRAYYA
jgi:hypothetical protein